MHLGEEQWEPAYQDFFEVSKVVRISVCLHRSGFQEL